MENKFLFIMFTENFYKYYYVLNTAATLKACDMEVVIFFSGYSCNFIKKKWITSNAKEVHKKIQEKGMESYDDILLLCKELNIKFYYCSSALTFLNIKKKEIISDLSITEIGLYNVINSHKKDQIIFI